MAFALSIGGVTPEDLGGDEDRAIRIILRAQELAPGMPDFTDESDERKAVLAILKGVTERASTIGSGAIASQARAGTSRSYRDLQSAFFPEDISGLRALIPGAPKPGRAMPLGSFPTDRPVSRLFPEGGYS